MVYLKFCRENGFSEHAPTFLSVAGFLADHVVRLKGSAKTVGAIIGAIKRYCVLSKVAYLSDHEKLLLADLVKELELKDTKAKRQVRPLTRFILDAIYQKGDRSCGRERMVIVIMTVAHDAMLRSGEISGGLRAIDFSWNKSRRSVTIHFLRTKTHRKYGGISVTIYDYGRRSGCAMLRRWFRDMNLKDSSTEFVFPQWDARRKAFVRDKCLSSDQLRKMMKDAVESVGLRREDFSGHSCRAGGATDAFNAGAPYAAVKKFGRWRSDTVLEYYRDEDEVATCVSSAFGRLGFKGSRKIRHG
jgi:integrase